jgi:hypothetical protein
MKNVIAYTSTVPNLKNMEKIEVLEHFISGVNTSDATGILSEKRKLITCNLAVIQGFVHSDSPTSTHLNLRKDILKKQSDENNHTLIIDSNLFLSYDPGNSKHYLRYSLDGVFPTTGNYFWDNPDPQRWNTISKNLNITVKDWRLTGNHILICLQRNGGWSMKGLNVMEWLNKTVKEIRQYSDRPIIVRAHPGDRNAQRYLKKDRRWKISESESILQDLENAWATVTYNSSPGVVSAIQGVPVFVTDPTPIISQAYDIANTRLKLIETPGTFDRLKWLRKLSMCHWNFDELKSGKAWNHIKNYL